MSTPNVEPAASPDVLQAEPKRGVGVRRLNRVPLIVLCSLVAVAILAVTYTFHQRQQEAMRQQQAAEEEVKVAEPVGAPVRLANPDSFIEPARDLPQEIPAAVPTQGGQPVQQVVQTPAQPSAADQARDQALAERYQQIAAVEKAKLQSLEAALGAPATVEAFKDGGQQAANPGGVPGLPTGGGLVPPLLGGGPANQRSVPSSAQLAAMLGGGGGNSDPNRQGDKRGFLAGAAGDPQVYLKDTRNPAVSPYEVKAGTVIPGVLIGGLNSDLPGQIIGQVRQNVYDTATGQLLLIPQGARLVGTYDSSVTMGQKRALVAWQRIIYPDGSSVSLGGMPGTDQGGYAGFRDKVDNHYWRIYGNAALMSLFSAGIQLSQPRSSRGGNGEYSSQEIMAGELGRQLGQLGMETTRRNMDIQPTLEIRPGYLFNIMVTKDMILPPPGSVAAVPGVGDGRFQ